VEGNNFIDRPLFEKQKAEGVSRQLIHFELTERGIPRHDYNIVNEQGEVIGKVTSGTILPGTKTGIGMGYVATPYATKGSTIYVDIRGKKISGIVK